MSYKSPEQLEQEADELLKAAQQPPATDSAGEPAPSEAAEAAATDDAPKGKKPEGEKPAADAQAQPHAAPPDDSASAEATDSGDGLDELSAEQLRERLRNAKSIGDKRVSDAQRKMAEATQQAAQLRRENDGLSARLQSLESEVVSLKSQQPASPAPATDSPQDADLAAMESDFPSLAPLFQHVAQLRARNQQLEAKLAQVEGNVSKTSQDIEADRKQEAYERHVAAIEKVHPDAFEIVETDDFNGWLERQAPMDQRVIQRDGTARDINAVLSRYKADAGITSPVAAVNDRIAKARSVATPNVRGDRPNPKTSKPTFTRAQINAMSMDEFARREPEIDEAMREGRVT